jgi:uncharacterized protein (TIGR03435 family)
VRICRGIILGGVVLGTALGQTLPKRLEFEVASVKPAEGLVAGRAASGGMRVDGAQVHLNSYMLKSLIAMAYNLKLYQVNGPIWLELRFHVDATLPAGTDRRQVPEMVQSMLADRFQLKFHNQSKEFPVYALVVAAGVTKLQDQGSPEEPSDPKGAREASGYGGPGGMGGNYSDGASYSLENNRFEGRKLTMARMASLLSGWVDRPVVDLTALQGRYDLSFPVAEEDLHGMIRRAFVTGGGSLSPEALHDLDSMELTSLHAGLRSFGLRLEASKSSLPVLIVDSILKSPTEN